MWRILQNNIQRGTCGRMNSACQHALDAGEAEHEIGDLEDLPAASIEILGAARAHRAVSLPDPAPDLEL